MLRTLLLCLGLALLVSACNTINGMGKDIEKAGEAVQKSTK